MFQLGGIVTSIINLFIWLALRRRLKLAFPKRGGLFGIIVGVVMLLLLHPSFAMAIASWSGMRFVRDLLPEWAQILCMGAQFAAWTYAVVNLVIVGPAEIRNLVRKLRKTEPKPIDENRRKLISRVGLALPAAAIVVAGAGVAGYHAAPVVTRLRLPVRRDMTNLHGLTIAQISDVHIGSYMDRERLAEFQSAMNALGADIHVITGDLMDNHISQLELANFLVGGLKPKRGPVYLCMGNHEYYTARSGSVKQIIEELGAHNGRMLIDETEALDFGSDRVWLSGIDYEGRGEADRTTRESLQIVTSEMKDDGAPRIVLAHHPRNFFEGREFPIDLMLSGHTHGGQIKLGRIGDAALTPILPIDYYHNGHYEHDGRRLYVNAGAGGWLPVRLNCPPEITLFELVAEA
ncbi:MAG: metallophosphoesterase [Planctomycetes bacterium]|nr:metallophosphoesterase [Planctomycetota bacterium]